VVVVVTWIDPTAGGMAVQVMVKATVAVAPATTVAVLDALSALQFEATSESTTVCAPAEVFGTST
jgi:hypothetical protein